MQFNSNPSTGSADKPKGSFFLKIEDGKTVYGVFRGETYEFRSKYEGNRSNPVPEGTPGSKFSFRINFVTKENGAFVAKVWEQGAITYGTLKTLHETFGLEQTIVSIKRQGTGKDTSYVILPTKEFKVTPDMEKQLSYVKLHDLGKKKQDDFAYVTPAADQELDKFLDDTLPF